MKAELVSSGPTFVSPGPEIFDIPPIVTVAGVGVTKPMLTVVGATVLVAGLFLLASRRAQLVPGRYQYFGESVYGYVRNSIVLESIGSKGLRFVPFLATLFTFIAVLNMAGIIPLLQFPATSHMGFSLAFAVMAWLVYNAVGIKHQGVWGYFKNMMFPPGIPKPVYVLLAPIEFFSTVLVRPVTLALRLTLNMFAGHLVLVLFVLGGNFLIFEYGGLVGVGSGVLAMAGSIGMTFFEGFIQLLQAYVFTLLTALYIGGALSSEH